MMVAAAAAKSAIRPDIEGKKEGRRKGGRGDVAARKNGRRGQAVKKTGLPQYFRQTHWMQMLRTCD